MNEAKSKIENKDKMQEEKNPQTIKNEFELKEDLSLKQPAFYPYFRSLISLHSSIFPFFLSNSQAYIC